MAPLGPAATMVSKLRESAPASRMATSIRQAISRSVSAGRIVGVTRSMAASDASMAFCNRSISSRSLTVLSPSTIPEVAARAGLSSEGRSFSALEIWRYVATVTCSLSKPRRLCPCSLTRSRSQVQSAPTFTTWKSGDWLPACSV